MTRGYAKIAPTPLGGTPSLRRVGKDCLVSFDGSFYSVPARRVRPGQQVEVRVTQDETSIHQPEPAKEDHSLLAFSQPRGGEGQLGRRWLPLGRPSGRPHPERHHQRARRAPARGCHHLGGTAPRWTRCCPAPRPSAFPSAGVRLPTTTSPPACQCPE
ncbi:Mu transposase domain-containing protein [Streptomyces sp. NPDC002285]